MKRPFGLIGLTYLTVLAVVFYFGDILTIPIVICGIVAVILGLFFKRNKSKRNTLVVSGITIVCACLSIILYTNIVYLPVIDNYSDKELNISGYVSEEVQKNEGTLTYTITTDKINGEDKRLKINLVSYADLSADEFERVNAKLYTCGTDNGYNLSKGIFLTSYYDEECKFEPAGETQFSLYSYAVSARMTMKESLDSLLSEDYSALCKAVLLGDKKALSQDIKSSFSDTGTSFLIVVSGMHLAIVVGFILFLLKKITKNRIDQCVVIIAVVISFMAITGFTPSVIRSGVMVIVTCCATLMFRRSDSINSLGIAALVLTLFNPYSVGDIGMLLSFSATFGIILWSQKITDYIVKKLNVKNKIIKYCVNAIAVSLSASLWIIPITTIAFGKISPYVVIISFFSQPIVSLLLIFAMLASLLYLCPVISFLAYPSALIAGLLAKLFLFIITFFASVPYCSVNSDKVYFYVWIAVSVLLVIIGYAVKAKGFYIKCAVTFSVSTLILGWAMYSFVIDDISVVRIYSTGYGITASAESGDNITMLSCGGSVQYQEDIIESISNDHLSIDNIIILNQKNKYSKYLSEFLSEFDVSNILVYDSNSEYQTLLENFDGHNRSTFSGNVHFSLNIGADMTDEVLCIDGVTYQYISSDNKSMLFAPTGADISKLPEQYRKADYLLTDTLPENYDLLSCDEVIFAGEKNKLTEKYNSLSEISDKIIYCNKTMEFEF